MRITVAYVTSATLASQQEVHLVVADGTSLEQALAVARAAKLLLPPDEAIVSCGVWGKVKPRTWLLREGDRVEVYRPLVIDPKLARRAKGQRVRGKVAR